VGAQAWFGQTVKREQCEKPGRGCGAARRQDGEVRIFTKGKSETSMRFQFPEKIKGLPSSSTVLRFLPLAEHRERQSLKTV
jgi:hypothetical protein